MYSTISNTTNTMPNRQSSLLNVTDPRYSATYGNPLLRQCSNTAPRGLQYSTFMPSPVAPPQVPISNGGVPIAPAYNTYVSLPMSSRNQLPTSSSQVTSGSTSTPNSSISNMACLPEDQDSNSKRSPQETPSPPPAPNPPMTTT